jgi:glucosamine 6-phosphate synthetase-like amidotransferase/phosphosugar isomerase protein
MTEMIAAEPALAERVLHRLGADAGVGDVADLVRVAAQGGGSVIVTGCGTSEHAAMGIAAMLREALEAAVGVRAAQALEGIGSARSGDVVIGVSHEGGTAATNEALRSARDAGAHVALITAGPGSPGAEIAGHVLATGEQDQSWCHTVGYLSPLLAGIALAARLSGSRPDALAVRALLDVSEDARSASDVAAALAEVDRLVVVGSGVDAITARELALKVAEGARLPAAPLELETVLHGSLAAATRWTGLVVVATAEAPPFVAERCDRVLAAGHALGLPTAGILSEARAAHVPPELTPAGRIVIPHTDRVPGAAGALLGGAMALQLLTERLARARSVDPDTLGREDPAQAAAHA